MVWLGSTIGYFLNEEECVTCVETLASDHNGPWSQAKELVLNLKKQVESIKVIKSVQFSCSVMSDSLRPHGLQHVRLPCPSSTPEAYSNSCPSWWCHPTISSCCPLLLLPSIFPSIRVFSNESFLCIRWPKYWSFSFSISSFNEYLGLVSLGWTGWMSL